MDLPLTSIRRPVLAIVASVALVIFGGIGFMYLPVREYPAVDPPVITVNTSYTGAASDVVDSQITEVLEQAINGVAGIKNISSTSREGNSSIRVEFDLSADIETAANDIRDKVSQVVRQLPDDADPPTVEKADADSDPIILMIVQSETKNILEVSALASNVIAERMQTIPGVSTVRIFGERKYAMRLWMDPNKMVALGITPSDVRAALAAQNVDLPSGRIEGNATELSVRTLGRLATSAEFEKLILKEEDQRQITFGDIGYAELNAENLRSGLKSGGLPMIGVALIPQPNTNAIAIADEFYKRFEQIKKEVPADYKMEIGYDFTTFVRRSIHEVQETLVIAFLLVAAIIFIFLRDWRSTIIPVIAIPVSIIAAFFIMYIAGFSINILTLVGVVLAIGLVCDDAIVVLENIYSKIEEGMTPLEAALVGSKEIYFAVISTTITLAVVFLPIIFLQGLTGRLFREFGMVVVGSVLVSAFVALTLSPMMCRYMLRSHDHGFLYRITEPIFLFVTKAYRWTLVMFLKVRWLTFPIIAVIAFVVIYTGKRLPSELAPLEDRSNIRINTRAPEGASYEYTEHYMDQMATWIEDNIPEISQTFSILGRGDGVNSATQNIYFTEPNERTRSQSAIFQQISGGLSDFTGLRIFPAEPPTIGSRRGSGQPVQFVLRAPSVEALIDTLPKFLEEANKSDILRFVDADFKINRPQLSIALDRQRAAELGVSVEDIARTLQLALGGQRFGYFLKEGKQYQVIGQLNRGDRDDPDDLKRLFVRSSTGDMISLDSLVTTSENASPSAIYRFDRFVSATISAGLAPDKTLGDGIAEMQRIGKQVLPPSFSTTLAGQSRDFVDSSSSLLFAFVLALVLIYLVLAAQFESFVDPFIILFTVPLSLAGALLSLYLTKMSMNIFSQIGIIMLIGLVTKNGILIVEFANQRKLDGLNVIESVLDASVSRFRPILMTSFATILGILPIALSLGAAAGSRQSLGIAVVGGLMFATFLTLYVVPAVYSYLSAPAKSAEELKEAKEEMERAMAKA